ncbi:MAG: ABC transporter substrate-binding protein [Lautropia sp.]|nr:ABC transporter substrate-binding protein [Lautropia sp.]
MSSRKLIHAARRDFNRRLLQAGVATVAGTALFGTRNALAADKAVLGHFGSANPQTYAKATGAFQKALGDKAAVDFVTVSAGSQVISAMAGGSIDICNVGSSPMVVGFGQELDISMVYIEKIITDSECLAVRKDAGIDDVKGLKGKTVGLPFNTSVHFAFLSALKRAGLAASDVRLLNLKPDSIVATWDRKDIDATFIWYPILGDVVEKNGKIILTSGDLADQGTLVFDGIVVRNEFKKKSPDLVLAYLKEYDRLCTLYREKPQEVIQTLSPYLNLAPEKTKAYVDSFHSLTPKEMATDKWMGKPGAKDTGVLKTLRDQAEFLKSADQMRKVPESFERYVDSTFLAKMV